MAENSSGLRKLLLNPLFYDFFQFLVGTTNMRKYVFSNFIKIPDRSRILDIGCGTGVILKYIPKSAEYIGFDINPQVIDYAKKRYKDRGIFFCFEANEIEKKNIYRK